MKLWAGRFGKETNALVEEFTSSIHFDKRLYQHDIKGSIAHGKMLARQGIITHEEAQQLVYGLETIQGEIAAGNFPFATSHEDIHMHIEAHLTKKLGPVAGKLHTARSRNDQVAVDTHLFVREQCQEIMGLITTLQWVLVELAEKHEDVIMPGYTHLQLAQPILFAHHVLAYFAMLDRDWGRVADCMARADYSPLGAGALAGTTFPIDREYTARELGFAGIYENSLDAVSDRDYILEFLAAAAILMQHLSRLCEELILWSTVEFNFIELDDAFTTGSSIMPQKKNPDVPELIRGKTGRVYGNLMGLLATMKGLPLAYNKDLQEDKEPLFDTVDTVKTCLEVCSPLLSTMTVKGDNMWKAAQEGFTNATDVADYLARQGVPFREAHHIVGRLVRYCLDRGLKLTDLTMEQWQDFSPLFGADISQAIKPEAVVAARSSTGGTAPKQVQLAIALAKEKLVHRIKGNSAAKS